MPELQFQEHRHRDCSPDSVIFTLESNFTLFSSASASVDRCSFASDSHDHESLSSLQLAVHDGDFSPSENWSGPRPDSNSHPNKHTPHKKHSRFLGEEDKVKVEKEDCDADEIIEYGNQLLELDSARNSFSLALKECQDRRSRSEALLKKPDRRRPASLDLNNATGSSPRLGTMKKSPSSIRKSNNFPSPGTPNYRQAGVVTHKGWSSERVPLHNSGIRKQVSGAMLPLNSGRTLPSKWEDAERWIFSPVSGDGKGRCSLPHPQRRPKSKSGPLGPPGIAYHSLYSPAVHMVEGGNVGNFMAGSPFTAGVIRADGLAIHSSGHGGLLPTRVDPCMARSASVHGCSEMQNQSSLSSQEEKFDCSKDEANNVSRVVSRRDMATQMSPESSPCSSLSMRASFSVSPSPALPINDLQSPSSHMDIRDVQIDERVTMTRWSNKHRALFIGRGSETPGNWKKKERSAPSSAWDVSETAKSASKVKREEARISAWENLQKAKAEAAIRKLEVKLEKKRSSSMDKIMNKLKLAQKKAQEMRSTVSDNQAHQVGRNLQRVLSFRRPGQMSSFSGCFTCHAF